MDALVGATVVRCINEYIEEKMIALLIRTQTFEEGQLEGDAVRRRLRDRRTVLDLLCLGGSHSKDRSVCRRRRGVTEETCWNHCDCGPG